MKNFCIIHILLFLLLMLAYQCAGAQDYLVTTANDTLRGEIKPLTLGPEKKVQVNEDGKKKAIYPIVKVRSYIYKGEKYEPVRTDKGYTFMKVINPGYLSLYGFQMENQMAYDGLYLLKKDGTGIEVPNLSFKKQLVKFLADCEAIADKVERGELTKKNIQEIVNGYNECIANRTRAHDREIAIANEQTKKISAWDILEEKIKGKTDFEKKNDALDMISEIKNKIKRSEKIPNFLLESLKSSLAQTDLTSELENALNELNH
ncbi:MAG: hypothetical protein ACOYXT_25030 [Bacteroidota bacterium]